MSVRGEWTTLTEEERRSQNIVGGIRLDPGMPLDSLRFIEAQYIEDDGRPFEEGEEVEIIVRRVRKPNFWKPEANWPERVQRWPAAAGVPKANTHAVHFDDMRTYTDLDDLQKLEDEMCREQELTFSRWLSGIPEDVPVYETLTAVQTGFNTLRWETGVVVEQIVDYTTKTNFLRVGRSAYAKGYTQRKLIRSGQI